MKYQLKYDKVLTINNNKKKSCYVAFSVYLLSKATKGSRLNQILCLGMFAHARPRVVITHTISTFIVIA